MFNWNFSETIPTNATPEQIWAQWQDATNWPNWDSELDWVGLDGPFENGTKGRMKPSGGPEVAFELCDIIQYECFSDKARLPLTDMVFTHEYLPQKDGGPAHIRHSISMSGLLAPVFSKVVGSQIKAHLRGAMETLSEMASSAGRSIAESAHAES